MEMTLTMGAFEPLAFDEMLAVDGGVNWDRVFGGTTVFLGTCLTVAMATNPISGPAFACCCLISAASGAYTGYGFVS